MSAEKKFSEGDPVRAKPDDKEGEITAHRRREIQGHSYQIDNGNWYAQQELEHLTEQ
jgi:hypothetical protein